MYLDVVVIGDDPVVDHNESVGLIRPKFMESNYGIDLSSFISSSYLCGWQFFSEGSP